MRIVRIVGDPLSISLVGSSPKKEQSDKPVLLRRRRYPDLLQYKVLHRPAQFICIQKLIVDGRLNSASNSNLFLAISDTSRLKLFFFLLAFFFFLYFSSRQAAFCIERRRHAWKHRESRPCAHSAGDQYITEPFSIYSFSRCCTHSHNSGLYG